jgi:DUF1680 family protein
MFSVLSTRREFLQRTAMLGAALGCVGHDLYGVNRPTPATLKNFSYRQVTLDAGQHQQQLENSHAVLMELDEDGLMKPFRTMSGKAAPGKDLGGWYMYKPDYDYRKDSAGLCPAGTFGQWVSALSRYYAITGDQATKERIHRLNHLYAQSVGDGYFDKNRFPAYCYDKLVCGLIDAHEFADDPNAWSILAQTTGIALPHLPPHAVDREQSWRAGKEGDISYNWDESYTLPENLFLAYRRGAGERYKQLAIRLLDDQTYFDPLAAGVNVLPGKHAYSYVNALNSAIQAYLVLGSEKHLRAARNAFEMLIATQSFATGGWGPDEQLKKPDVGALAESLIDQHQSFETPCGAYAHFKLTRSLIQITQDPMYGDSMERVMYNTVLGAKPLLADGTAFYYSDYSSTGQKGYSRHRWPCCSGTLPQIAADYRISAYFHNGQDLFVNLYIPSTVRWDRAGNRIEVRQSSQYPYEDVVRFEVTSPRNERFTIRFRVPAWAEDASLSVNGTLVRKNLDGEKYPGLNRRWRTGDCIELQLPMRTRLEAIDSQHPNTVALMYGPLVLFPLTHTPPRITKEQLLSAKRATGTKWQLTTNAGTLNFLPFTEISDEDYCTYMHVT